MDDEYDSIVDELIKLGKEEIIKNSEKEWSIGISRIGQLTNIFIERIEKKYKNIITINEFVQIKKRKRELAKKEKISEKDEKEIMALDNKLQQYNNKDMNKALQEARNIVKQYQRDVLDYQKALGSSLGIQLETDIVYADPDNGEVHIYRFVGENLSQILSSSISLESGMFRSAFLLSQANLSNKNLFEDITGNFNILNDSLTETYLEVLNRARISIEKRVKKDSKYPIIVWKPNGKYKHMAVYGGEGDIGEAYRSFLTTDRKDFATPYWTETTIDYFMTGVSLVDQVSGLFVGDTREENGVEVAVKALNAYTLMYRQIIDMAYLLRGKTTPEILKILKERYETDLEKSIALDFGTRNKVKKGLQETTRELTNRVKRTAKGITFREK